MLAGEEASDYTSESMAMTLKQYKTAFASKGGKARAKKLSPSERTTIAKKAASARWAKHEKKTA